MAASEAVIGYGTIFKVETAPGSDSFTAIAEVTSITPPNDSVDQIEVTHMESPNRTKEFIAGLSDPGEMRLELNHIPGSDTDEFIIAWRASGAKRACQIEYPNSGPTDEFPAFVLGYAPTLAVADKLSATLTLKVAGAVVRTA